MNSSWLRSTQSGLHEGGFELREPADDVPQAEHEEIHLWRYSLAELLHRIAGDEQRAVLSTINLARRLRELKRSEEALELLRTTRRPLSTQDSTILDALAEADIGLALAALGQYSDAIVCQESARQAFDRNGNRRLAAVSEMNIGNLLAEMGQHQEALKRYASSRAALSEEGQTSDLAQCDANIGIVLGKLGDYKGAMDLLETAKSILETLGMTYKLAVVHQNLGVALLSSGLVEEGKQSLRTAQSLFASEGAVSDASDCEEIIDEIATGEIREGLPVPQHFQGEHGQQTSPNDADD